VIVHSGKATPERRRVRRIVEERRRSRAYRLNTCIYHHVESEWVCLKRRRCNTGAEGLAEIAAAADTRFLAVAST
jgi:hypothetical protein